MSQFGWTPWQISRPDRLPGYVHPELVAELLPGGLPGGARGERPARARAAYDAVAAAAPWYVQPMESDGLQPLLTPFEVLVSPRNGTCIDLSLVYCAAALHADLHPRIVLLGGTSANHAVVLVWLGGNRGQATAPTLDGFDPDRIRETPTSAGDWMPVDVATAAKRDSGSRPGQSFDDAVQHGAVLLRDRPWVAVVDVGAANAGVGIVATPEHPSVGNVLDSPYEPNPQPPGGDRGDIGFRLQLITSDYTVVPFRRRIEFEQLSHAVERTAPGSQLQVAVIAGVGGAGKTRLIAELCRSRAEFEHWHTGWLPTHVKDASEKSHRRLRWLAATGSPLIVAIDYAEGRTAEVEDAIECLASRAVGPTWLLLGARETGSWYHELRNTHRQRATFHEVIPIAARLGAADLWAHAVTAFEGEMGRQVTPDVRAFPTESVSRLWTTLDVIMTAWLHVFEGREVALDDRNALYDTILDHEQRLWAKIWDDRYRSAMGSLPDAERSAMRLAATVLTCRAPSPSEAEAALQSVPSLAEGNELSPRGTRIADVLATALRARGSSLGVRPDPVADRLIALELTTDPPQLGHLLLATLTDSASTEVTLRRIVRAAQTAQDRRLELTALLCKNLLEFGELWGPVLAVAATEGGIAIDALDD